MCHPFHPRQLRWVLLISIFASPQILADTAPPRGLDSLDDNALYTELADRGLDDLLKRAMDQDHVPPEQRTAISSMSSLNRLDTEKNLTDDQRQALLDTVVGGVDRILATLHNDPDLILKEAKIIAEHGVDPLTGLLEYWGDSDIERNRLHPLADAAFRMYDQAAQVASAQANDLANRITSPDDKLADQWKEASQTAAAAAYQRARMQYAARALFGRYGPAAADFDRAGLEGLRRLGQCRLADSNAGPAAHGEIACSHRGQG